MLAEGLAALEELAEAEVQPLAPGDLQEHGVAVVEVGEGVADQQDAPSVVPALGQGEFLGPGGAAGDRKGEKKGEKPFHTPKIRN